GPEPDRRLRQCRASADADGSRGARGLQHRAGRGLRRHRLLRHGRRALHHRRDREAAVEELSGMAGSEAFWWQRGVIYQIYPRSFQDSNGDGIGDLAGITQRLDYLKWLGIDALWISPIFPSPMKDFGYDISDYTGIDPIFGTLGDFDALLEAAHARDLKIMLDFVPNHTSDQHPWFRQSRKSRDNPYRDWYIWRDPARGGGPPNNWLSEFGGGAWTLDEATG